MRSKERGVDSESLEKSQLEENKQKHRHTIFAPSTHPAYKFIGFLLSFQWNQMNRQIPNDGEPVHAVSPQHVFFPGINEAHEQCSRARSELLEIRAAVQETPSLASSPIMAFCDTGLAIADAEQGAIETINYSFRLTNRLR
jgi:hypothetical protein